jgi:Ca2+-binding EF-hand superfamily protein
MENSEVLEQDELEHLRKIFNKFDIGGDGNITFEVALFSIRYCQKL